MMIGLVRTLLRLQRDVLSNPPFIVAKLPGLSGTSSRSGARLLRLWARTGWRQYAGHPEPGVLPAGQSGATRALPNARTLTDHAPECAGEVGLIRESDIDGDLRERKIAFQQKLLRFPDPRLQQPLMGGEPRRGLESTAEIRTRQLHQVAHRLQLDVFGQMGGEILGDTADLPGRQLTALVRLVLGCVQTREREHKRNRQGIAIELRLRFPAGALLGEQVSQMHDSRMGEHQPRREGAAEVDLVFQHARQGRAIELEHEVANEADTRSLSISPRSRRNKAQGSRGILRRRPTAPRLRP